MNYTKNELAFKEKWVKSAVNAFYLDGVERERAMETFSAKFDERFKRRTLNIFNSFYYENYYIDAARFFLMAPENFILNENGVLTVKTSIRQSIESKALLKNIDIRQIFKRAKQAADNIREKNEQANNEKNNKLVINGQYGLSGYVGASFFNIDLADTTTTAGRNIVSVSALCMESVGGGWRGYDVTSHIKLLEYTRKQVEDEVAKKYTLDFNINVEDVLKQLLGYHYETYYAKSYLRSILERQSEDVLKLLYLKNNYDEFILIPEVKTILLEIFEKLNKGETLHHPKIFDESKGYVFGPQIKAIQQIAKDLLYGFVYFSGDYIDGKYYPTMVDLIANKKRNTVVGMDTDSNNSTMYDFNMKLMNTYKEEIGNKWFNKEIRRDSITVLNAEIMIGCIEQVLYNYTTAIGVDEKFREKAELELEHVMEHIQLTTSKKQYVYIPSITDFKINKKRKMSVTGLIYTKGNVNEEISDIIDHIIFNYIMVEPEKLNYAKIINTIKLRTITQKELLRTEDYVRNKKTIMKIVNKVDLTDYRLKAVKLWNFMFGESIGLIELPGSFGIINISLSKEILEDLEKNYPDTYNKLYDFVTMIMKFKLCSRAKTFHKSLMDEEDNSEAISKILNSHPEASRYVETMKSLSKVINKFDLGDYNENDYNYLKNTYGSSGEALKAILTKCWGIKKKIDMYSVIIDECTRIAVPQDTGQIPDFISRNDYEIIDINSILAFEHLLSPMLDSLSLVTPRNSEERMVLTNILQTY